MSLPDLIQALLEPSFYPHRPADVELRQTHISYVFLAGAEVYKVKKPVRLTFLDFTTLELRRHFCAEEVRLNRRLAPGVYLGVVGIRREGDGFGLTEESDPEAIEYAVHMRRLPDERTLERSLLRGEVEAPIVDRLAALLVDFHRGAEVSERITANGTPAAILRVLQDNYAGGEPFHGITISAEDDAAIEAYARDFLARNEDLLRRRREQQQIRDGHADLRAEHVYLTEPPVIVDCVEFKPEFRWCDVASDLAFLVMDLDYSGRSDLATRLVERYGALAGDAEVARLIPFYACYRAYVRGKVESLKSSEEEVGEKERDTARQSARRHFALSYRYTWSERRAVVAISGLSGTGKSVLARRMAERTGYTHVSSDVVRKQLAGLAPTERAGGARHSDLYSGPMSHRTYDALFGLAGETVRERGVVLDATFQLRQGRDRARAIAAAAKVPFLLVECRCDDVVVGRRLAARARRGDDPSDADWQVYLEQKRRFEGFGTDENRLVLDTAGDVDALVRTIERELRGLEGGGPPTAARRSSRA